MWLEEAWLTNIVDSKVKRFLEQEVLDVAGAVALEGLKYYLFAPWAIYDLIRTGIDIAELKKALDKAFQAKSLYNLNPIHAKLGTPANLRLDLVRASGIRLRLAMVGLESGALRYVTESGEMLEKDLHTQALTQIQALAPECQQITNDIAALETKRIVAQNRFGTAGPGEKAVLAAQLRGLCDQIAQKRLALAKCTKVHPSTMRPRQ